MRERPETPLAPMATNGDLLIVGLVIAAVAGGIVALVKYWPF